MFLRHTWRARWRSLVLLAAMVGLAGGVSLAAAAGARRSSSSLERFEAAANVLDVFVAGEVAGQEPPKFLDLLEGPLVDDHNDLVFLFADDTYSFYFAPTSRRGLDVESGTLLEGRRADPDDPDEIVLSQVAARLTGLGVGDTLEVPTIDQAQADALLQGQPPEVPAGPTLQLEVVGLVRNGFDLGGSDDAEALTFMTPAFLEKYGDGQVGVGAASHMMRLADVPNAIDRFTDAIVEAYDGGHLPSINVGQRQETVADAISVITAALAVAALVIAVVGTVWIGSAASRQMRLAEPDVEILRALGATQRERRLLFFGTVLPALVAGVAVAPILAVALSPLFPVGVARSLDPDPGVHLDAATIGVGVLVLVGVVVLLFLVSALRLAGQAKRVESGVMRPPRFIDRVARSLRPAAAAGVRFALYAPRRVSAPVRPALLGAFVGVVGLVAVAVVGASLQRLVDTPARWGTSWDLTIGGIENNDLPLSSEAVDRQALLSDDDVAAAGVMLYDEQVTVNGVESIAMTFEQVKGDLTPTIVDGHEPRASDEVVLGRDTLDAADASIGDEVTIESRSQQRGTYTVVGVVAFPAVGSPPPLAVGASFTPAGGDRLDLGKPNDTSDFGNYYVTIRWADDVDENAAIERLGYVENQREGPIAPPEVDGLRDVERFPLLAASALALLGSIATTHALLVTVRRRRLELGVLSALGFVPAQRSAAIVVQATTVALVALVAGIPLGAVLGRMMWSAIATSIGVGTDARFPLTVLLGGALALVVVLNLIAAGPALSARRLQVADALRSE